MIISSIYWLNLRFSLLSIDFISFFKKNYIFLTISDIKIDVICIKMALSGRSDTARQIVLSCIYNA